MYNCIYMYIYVCMYACMHACMYVCMYICACACVSIHSYGHFYVLPMVICLERWEFKQHVHIHTYPYEWRQDHSPKIRIEFNFLTIYYLCV